MSGTITSSPAEHRAELERSITYNYEAYKKQDQTRNEYGQLLDKMAETFERRFNVHLQDYGRLVVEHEVTD